MFMPVALSIPDKQEVDRVKLTELSPFGISSSNPEALLSELERFLPGFLVVYKSYQEAHMVERKPEETSGNYTGDRQGSSTPRPLPENVEYNRKLEAEEAVAYAELVGFLGRALTGESPTDRSKLLVRIASILESQVCRKLSSLDIKGRIARLTWDVATSNSGGQEKTDAEIAVVGVHTRVEDTLN